MEELWEIVKRLLEENKMSISELSKKSGIPKSTLYSLISRKSKAISHENIMKISEAFEVTSDYLMGWTKDKSGQVHHFVPSPHKDMSPEEEFLYAQEIVERAAKAASDLDKKRLDTLSLIGEDAIKNILPIPDKLISYSSQLNEAGQQKAIEQMELLTKIPEYQKEPNPQQSSTDKPKTDSPT